MKLFLILFAIFEIVLSINNAIKSRTEESFKKELSLNLDTADSQMRAMSIEMRSTIIDMAVAIVTIVCILMCAIYLYAGYITNTPISSAFMMALSMYSFYVLKDVDFLDADSYQYNQLYEVGGSICKVLYWINIFIILTK